ncbi:MAG: RluA family pseudouridine synthase [Chloroflexota bacterium]|nr:MAG: RNA pseudouridine synthase [Bellilinea sp.]
MFQEIKIDTLYIDEHLLVVNKPAGLRVIPDGYQKHLPDLHHLLMERFGKLWVVHRLDRETSGVNLFARDAHTHRFLNQQFQNRQIKKVYHLFAIGPPLTNTVEIKFPLRINGDRAHRTVIDFQKGKSASTLVRVIQLLPKNILLIEAEPQSGYTHQIRAHISAAGYWLLNDPLYFPWNNPPSHKEARPHLPSHYREICQDLPVRRIALHSYKIEFFHPALQRPLQVLAPYPEDFKMTLHRLKNESGI